MLLSVLSNNALANISSYTVYLCVTTISQVMTAINTTKHTVSHAINTSFNKLIIHYLKTRYSSVKLL